MTLKGEGQGPLPPLLVQYTELRERYPDYLLLFQVGDFYETFGEDAERFARAINITLTHKTSKDFSTPMAGIPVRSADTYLEKLLKQNVCVAIADQTEVATAADGLVKREVTQLVTPGTVTDEKLLRPDANYLAAVATGEGYGLTLLDVTTGEFRGTLLYSKAALFDELRRYRPAELLLAPELYAQEDFREGCSERFAVMVTRGRFDEDAARATLSAHFGTVPQGADDAVMRAAGAVLSYALTTQRGQLAQVTRFFALRPERLHAGRGDGARYARGLHFKCPRQHCGHRRRRAHAAQRSGHDPHRAGAQALAGVAPASAAGKTPDRSAARRGGSVCPRYGAPP